MRTLIKADRVIDGISKQPVEGAALLIEGDRILAVDRAADIGVPDGASVVEAPGFTIMPGMIDAHVHLSYSGSPNRVMFRAEHTDLNYAEIALRAARYAHETLRHGFTSVRDMHAPGGTIIDLRNAIDRGHVAGPRIRACGHGLSVTGGHMDQPGWADHTHFRDLTHPCDGADGFRRGVRSEIKRGADFIKLNTCTSTTRVPGRYCQQEMTDEEIRAACDEAHMNGRLVSAHTTGEDPLRATILNGVDCVEHAHFTDDSLVDLMAEQGTIFVPTLLVNERNFEIGQESLGVSPGHWEWLLASRDAKWATLERARKSGVKICAGTDAGYMIPHGSMNWREIALLVQGGLSSMEALVAATANNADLLQLEVGRLQSGYLADFLVVDGNPLDDIHVLADPAKIWVFKGGVRFS